MPLLLCPSCPALNPNPSTTQTQAQPKPQARSLIQPSVSADSLAAETRSQHLTHDLRLRTLCVHPPRSAVYADRLLSLVTTPFDSLEPLGASALRRVRSRMVPHVFPLPEERTVVVYLSRASQHPRRSIRNRPMLLRALRWVIHMRPLYHMRPLCLDIYT